MNEKLVNGLKIQVDKFMKEIIYWIVTKQLKIAGTRKIKIYLGLKYGEFPVEKNILLELEKNKLINIIELSNEEKWEDDYFGWEEGVGEYCILELLSKGNEWFEGQLEKEDDLIFSEIKIQRERTLKLLGVHHKNRGNGRILSLPNDFHLIDDFSENDLLHTNWIKMMFLLENEKIITINNLFLEKKIVQNKRDYVLNFEIKHNRNPDWYGTSGEIERINLIGGIYYLISTKTFYSENDLKLKYTLTKEDQIFLMEYLIYKLGESCPIKEIAESALFKNKKTVGNIRDLRSRLLAKLNSKMKTENINYISVENVAFKLSIRE